MASRFHIGQVEQGEIMTDNKAPSYIVPKEFFENTRITPEHGICFVLIPFKHPFDEIYNRIIRETVEKDLKMKCYKADSIYDPKPIMTTILEMIQKAEIIIADLTGRNPNVFYELGIAHSKKDNVIIISQNPDDVPFDLKHLRYIVYENSLTGAENLRLSLIKIIKTLRKETAGVIAEKGKGEELSRIISLESIIENTIEEHGAYMGELENEIKDKAEKKCEDFRKRALVPLAKKYGLKNIKIDKRNNKVTFEGGYIVSEFYRIGGEFDMVQYQVNHHFKTSPPNFELFDDIREQTENYDKLIFEIEGKIDIEDIFQTSSASGINIISIDENEISFDLSRNRKGIIKIEGNIVKFIIDCGYNPPKDLHRKISPQLIFDYLNGKINQREVEKIFRETEKQI